MRTFPPHGPSTYEIDPHELSQIFGDDTYTGISGHFVPTRISLDEHTGVPDVPADPRGSAEAPGTDAGHVALPTGPMPTWRPGPSPVIGSAPTPGTVVSLTEKAAIHKMHQLGIKMAEASQPPQLEHDDWELWSAESQATAIEICITQRDNLCLKINEAANALPSLRFSILS